MTDPHSKGFDVVLGNPPWERVKLQEQEFFGSRDPDISGAPNAAARKRMIKDLKNTNPDLLVEFKEASRRAEGESHLMRNSSRFPLCGRGDINTYAVFAESARDAIAPDGRVGIIVPTGIATDDTTKYFFGDLVETKTLVSYYGFKNERFLFPKPVEHTVTFGLLTLAGRNIPSEQMQFCWLAWTVDEMEDPARRIVLTTEDIERLNPNTRTCPVFRSERDAEITKGIYRRVPVLIREARDDQPESNPWGITFVAMFHMSIDSGLFVAPEIACPAVDEALTADPNATPPYLPLYEAKMLHQFDHRWATYARPSAVWLDTPINTKINKRGEQEPNARDITTTEHTDPSVLAAPRYWVPHEVVQNRLVKTDKDGNEVWCWDRKWLLGFRDIARNTDDRTLIATVFPRVGVSNKIPLIVLDHHDAKLAACLHACLDSIAADYVARQKVGGATLNFFIIKQFSILEPSAFAIPCPWESILKLADWIAPRVLELVYTAHDLAGFARDLSYDGPPFRWDETRRARIRAELDAAFFHLYGVSRDDADYIMDTFTVFKKRDEDRNDGVYKTKETILTIFDEMAAAIECGEPWQSPLDSPAGPPPDSAGNFVPMGEWDAWPSHIHKLDGVL